VRKRGVGFHELMGDLKVQEVGVSPKFEKGTQDWEKKTSETFRGEGGEGITGKNCVPVGKHGKMRRPVEDER